MTVTGDQLATAELEAAGVPRWLRDPAHAAPYASGRIVRDPFDVLRLSTAARA